MPACAAAPNLGPDYVKAFEAIYPELAAKYDVPLYPFFLDGAVANAALNQADAIHPTAAGVEVIVAGILPKVEELLARVQGASRLVIACHAPDVSNQINCTSVVQRRP